MTGSVVVAGFWGALAASSLVIGAVLALRARLSNPVVGSVMGFGAGALISSIAYELVPESLISDTPSGILIAFGAGALIFFALDWLIDNRGGRHRKEIAGTPPAAEGSGMAIFLGTLLDGIPESLTMGLSMALGGSISIAFLAAVFVSSIPEGFAGTNNMLAGGDSKRKVLGLWIGLVIVSAAAAAFGYAAVQMMPGASGRLVQGLAAGAMLTMLADAMMPEAFEHGGKLVGLLTTLGFLAAAVLSALEKLGG
jgi:ZIP family zinc transporter